MLARLRTGVAVAMLVGIPVLAVSVLAVLVGAVVWVIRTGTPIGLLVGSLLGSVAFVIVVALTRVLRTVPSVPEGMGVSVMAEPELWALVREAGDRVGTRAPDEVRLVADAQASVTEESRLLGLAPGVRVLHIGVPLLQTLTVSELRWVLGHEMAHYSERHPALIGLTRRGLVALVEVVRGLGNRHVVGWIFRSYLEVYARVVHAVWRGLELDADRWAAELAGAETGVAALRAVASTQTTWGTFSAEYGTVGLGVGMVPQGLFTGYADFLSEPARAVDVDALVERDTRSPFDTHPSDKRRIERLRQLSLPSAARPDDDRPALVVLGDPAAAIAGVEAGLAREASLTPVTWEQAVQLGNRRRDEERAVRVMSAMDAITSGPSDLSQALHLVGRGGGRQLAERLAGRSLADEEAADLALRAIEVLVRSALVGAGHASYVLRWDRPDVVVDEAGVEVDVAELVAGVPGNPSHADWLLEVLRAEGISRTWNPGVSSTRLGPEGPEVVAVLVGKQVRGYHPVLYVTEAGLGVRRLGYREYMSIQPISPQKTPAQLLQHSLGFDGLSLLRDPDTDMVPWDQVEHVTWADGERPRVTVRRRGGSDSYRAVAVAGDGLSAFTRFAYGRMSLG